MNHCLKCLIRIECSAQSPAIDGRFPASAKAGGRVGFGASRAVPAAEAERRLWVPNWSAVADN